MKGSPEMANNYYSFTNKFIPGTKARSDDVNNEYEALEAAFDNLPTSTDAINRGTTYLGVESGSGNLYSVALADVRALYQEGDRIVFRATHANTGSASIDIDGLGTVTIVRPDDSLLESGDIIADVYFEFIYDSTENHFQMLTQPASFIIDADARVDWAEEWAVSPENSLISAAAGGDGLTDYSSLHWASKAERWASTTGAIVESTDYSAKEYAIGTFLPAGSSKQWASELEDTEVVTGLYSALHYAAKSADSYDQFNDRYLGSKATDPTLDNDGDPLLTGALYWNSTNDAMRVYNGTSWQDVGTSTANITEWTVSGTQSAFSGTDDNGTFLSYTAGFLMVFQNGILLDPDDYVATDGSTVTLDVTAEDGDNLNMIGYGTFDIANHYTKAEADGQYAKVDAANTFTEKQTFQGAIQGDRVLEVSPNDAEVLLSGDVKLNDWDGAGTAYLAAYSDVPLADVSLTLRTLKVGVVNPVLTATADARVLALTASGISYDGQNVALEDTTNVFTKKQIIANVSPVMLLNETDQTDKNWGMLATGTRFYIGTYDDAGLNLSNKLKLEPDAVQLHVDSRGHNINGFPVVARGGLDTHNADYTMVDGDRYFIMYHSTGTHTWTLPTAANFVNGDSFKIFCYAGTVTLARTGSDQLVGMGTPGSRSNKDWTIREGGSAEIIKTGATQWFIRPNEAADIS